MENIKFTFEGQLASEHRMNFYESARFQYAASRLILKLDHYRRIGDFPKKITYLTTEDIVILPTRAGSYGLEILVPAIMAAAPAFINVPLEALISFVIDRVFRSTDDEDIRAALRANERLLDTFDRTLAGRDDVTLQVLDLLRGEIDHNRELSEQQRQIFERIISDQDRKQSLLQYQGDLRQIDNEDRVDLITMAAPLLKEMNVPLRKSARTLTIGTVSNDNDRRILHANKQMADSIKTEIVDRNIVTIDIDIKQFNKENGWGKFENENWEGRPSFSIPGEILDDLRETVIRLMRHDRVEVDCHFVRSVAGQNLRIIIVDVREIDE